MRSYRLVAVEDRCVAHNTLAVATTRLQSIARQQMTFGLGKTTRGIYHNLLRGKREKL